MPDPPSFTKRPAYKPAAPCDMSFAYAILGRTPPQYQEVDNTENDNVHRGSNGKSRKRRGPHPVELNDKQQEKDGRENHRSAQTSEGSKIERKKETVSKGESGTPNVKDLVTPRGKRPVTLQIKDPVTLQINDLVTLETNNPLSLQITDPITLKINDRVAPEVMGTETSRTVMSKRGSCISLTVMTGSNVNTETETEN